MMLALNKKRRRSRKGRARRSSRSNPFRRIRRRHSRRYSNRRRSRRTRHNPVAVATRGLMGKVTSGFKASTLTNAALIGAGAFGNSFLRQQIAVRLVPQAAAGIPSYLLGLATSGLLLFIPKVGSQLALGGVFGEVYRAARENIPQLKALGMMDDYIDTSSQIGDYIDSSSQIGDFLEAGQLSEYDEDSELGSYWEGNVGAGSQDTPTMGSRSIDASKTFE